MKIHLSFLKTRLLALMLFLAGCLAFGQNLVRYPLTSNLNPAEGPAAGMEIPGVDMIKYMDPPIQITPTDYTWSHLNFANNGDEVVLTFNASSYQGMSVQFRGGIGVFLAGASGNIKVFMKIGTGGADNLIAEHNFSSSWFGEDTYDFSPALAGADGQSLVQIRIVGTSSSFGLLSYFGIQNLRIVADNTTMNVRKNTAGYPVIPYNADASVTLDTDFGSRFTNDPNNNQTSQDKQYIITNTGLRPLKINSVSIAPSNQGFSIVSPPASTVAVNGTTTFTVRFSPQDQGLKIADVIINSNAIPNNPFAFQVKGNGKSCNLEPVPILIQNFETSGSNLNASVIAGTPNITGGNSNNPTPTIGGALFPSNTPLYAAGSNTRSLFVRGTNSADQNGVVGTGEVTLEFGPVDLTNQQEVSITFDVAAFSTSNASPSSNALGAVITGSGVNGYDYVTLSVAKDGVNFTPEITLKGASGSGENDERTFKYGFGGAQIPESNYDGTEVTATNTSTTKYGKFKLNIPPSALTSTLKFRIKARTGRSRERSNYLDNYKYYNRNLWLIDNVQINAGNAKVKTWTGTAWTGENTNRPGDREKAVFTGTYNFTATNNTTDLSVCECEVNSGATLTIPSGRALTVRNKVINHGDGSNFTVASDANLIQIEDGAVNTGNITVQRTVHPRKDTGGGYSAKEYSFYASPVENQNMKAIFGGSSANSAFALKLNEPANNFVNATTPDYTIKGKGFAVKDPTVAYMNEQPPGWTTVTAEFKNKPNNGIIETEVTRAATNRGWNLIGNPYPSNIDLQQFYTNNSSVIESTIRFWDKTMNNTYTQYGGNYNGYSYALYNASSNMGNPAPGNDGGENTGTPGSTTGVGGNYRYAKVGQGFLVRKRDIGDGHVTFNNGQREPIQTGSTFFGRSAEEDEDRNIYRLQLVTPEELYLTQSFVYYDGGSNSFGDEDTAHPSTSASDLFYSFAGETKAIINGRSTFNAEDVVSLGTRHYAAGSYTIRAVDLQGVFASGQAIYLKDRDLNTLTDLTQGGYTFYSDTGDYTNRFEIVYRPESTLATDIAAKDALKVYRSGNDFVIKSDDANITGVEAYDMSGRMIRKLSANSREVQLPEYIFSNGVYILKIWHGDQISTRKIRK